MSKRKVTNATGLPCNTDIGAWLAHVRVRLPTVHHLFTSLCKHMANDRINGSTERIFRAGQTHYTKRSARRDKGKGKMRPPSDGTPKEQHQKELRLAHKERPSVPHVTPSNSHKIGSGTAHTSFTVTTQRSQLKRSHGYIDSPRIHIINGDRLGKNPMGIPRE